jgi:hypothetical protein
MDRRGGPYIILFPPHMGFGPFEIRPPRRDYGFSREDIPTFAPWMRRKSIESVVRRVNSMGGLMFKKEDLTTMKGVGRGQQGQNRLISVFEMLDHRDDGKFWMQFFDRENNLFLDNYAPKAEQPWDT